MKILFVHQNFPGQFKFLAPALVGRGHEVVAMHMQKTDALEWKGVRLYRYDVSRGNTQGIHPWILDFETKIIRGEACYRAAVNLRAMGFHPDVVIAHPGWGESMFLKEVWPHAKLGIYCEFYYRPNAADVGFDPEFLSTDIADNCRVILKNTNNLLHFECADGGISPTKWQASTFPEPFASKITVVHDGVDTEAVFSDPTCEITLKKGIRLTRKDEVVTFVNRNLEPYRGYHIFMRMLPQLLSSRPNVRVLIVGGNEVSYGKPPSDGGSWKDILISEIRPHLTEQQWARVHFLGNIPYDKFIPLLRVSSVHVYLTYPFVLSWSLIESMCAECAIVGSDTAPVREVIKDGETGLLVDFFDKEGLAKNIGKLLDNRALSNRLGKSARKFALENYDLKTHCLPRQISWVEGLA